MKLESFSNLYILSSTHCVMLMMIQYHIPVAWFYMHVCRRSDNSQSSMTQAWCCGTVKTTLNERKQDGTVALAFSDSQFSLSILLLIYTNDHAMVIIITMPFVADCCITGNQVISTVANSGGNENGNGDNW